MASWHRRRLHVIATVEDLRLHGIAVALREGPTPEHLRGVRAGRVALAVVAMETAQLDDVADLRADVLLEGGRRRRGLVVVVFAVIVAVVAS